MFGGAHRATARVRAAGAVLAAVVAVACTPPAQRGPFTVPAGPCGDIALTWARGSSMEVASGEARSLERKFRAAVRDQRPDLRVDTFELGDLDADGVLDPGGYPAVPGGRMPGIDTRANPQRELQIIGGYNESTRVGAEELVSVLGTLHDRCPDQVFVVAGISQGADATMKGLQRLPDELTRRIAAVHVFGDPGFVVGPWMVAPRTRIPSGHGILGPRVPYVPDALRSRTTSWCGQFDGVCTGQFWLAILDAIEDCPKHRDLPICSARHTDYGYWAFGDAALQAATAAINSLR